jgi:thiol-disulfide isomerase/thioredoxin
MKLVMALLLFPFFTFSQTTTYSKEEEGMLQYVNNQYAYALKYDSSEILDTALDSCWKFLNKYPNSFAKPGVFSYMLEMAVLRHSDKKDIATLIDSTVYYDPSAVTKFRVAEMLIENQIDPHKGYLFLNEAFPNLNAAYHKYKSNILFARKAITDGKQASAKMFFEGALLEDSTRAEGWYEYASYLTFSEQTNELNRVKKKIQLLDQADRIIYNNYSKNSPNIGKEFLDYKLHDLQGNLIDLQEFEGKPLVAQYFSNWCPQPKKYPVLEKVSKDFPDAKIILISVLESPEELKTKYLNKPEYKYLEKYTILFEDSSFSNKFSGKSMGTLFLIDEAGKIILDLQGYSKDYEKLLREALKRIKSKK